MLINVKRITAQKPKQKKFHYLSGIDIALEIGAMFYWKMQVRIHSDKCNIWMLQVRR